jgi:uncharacterized protein (TIGR02996 family)
MDEMLPFLRAIAAHPDDDTPRLVFADWLDEHGQHERAEFIRLQIELARTDPSDPSYPAMTARMRRCGVLTDRGSLRFFDHIPTKKCKIAFRRGFIESIDTADAGRIDTSGFDLLPLQALRTSGKKVEKFKRFEKLKWLEYSAREAKPAQLLEVLGPKGWFKQLEELSLTDLPAACLEAGVVPQFDLPRLRNFYLSTTPLFELGGSYADSTNDEGEYTGGYDWSGLPAYLPRNAVPNRKCPLERFVWHSDDDSDYYRDDWFWSGPSMEALLEHLTHPTLKLVEVAVDHDDHENGAEGLIAAPYQRNPLDLSATLDSVTVNGPDLQRMSNSPRKLKGLRVFEEADRSLFTFLRQPVCSELESLVIDNRHGWWGTDPKDDAGIRLPKLTALWLGGQALGRFTASDFPALVTLLGGHEPATILQRKWPKLQHLELAVNTDRLAGLKAFAESDCCPNLTTLTLVGYFRPGEADFSCLATCPHMPHLSLVRFPDSYPERAWVVNDGELIPLRDDLMLNDRTPSMPYRFSVAFGMDPR